MKIIAFKDIDDKMVPAIKNKKLLVFQDTESAKAVAGMLGVASVITEEEFKRIIENYGLDGYSEES